MEIKFDFSLRKIETPHHPYDEEFFPDESAVIQEAPSIVTGINLTILVDWDDVSRPQTGSMKRNRAPRVSFSSSDARAYPMPPGSSHATSAEKVNCGVNPTRETPKASGGGTGVHPDIQFNSNDTTVSSENYRRSTTDSLSSDEYEDNSFISCGTDEYANEKNEYYSHAYDDDEVSIADGSSTIATRTYHCFDSSSMKSHDTTIKSKKSVKSSKSISYHSKAATDRTYKTAVYFDQIPEDDELPIDATDKLQMDLHHLQLKSSADLCIDPSTIHASNQIQPRHLLSSSAASSKLCPLQPMTSSSSTAPPSSIPHQGSSVAGAETSGSSKRSSISEHSRKYKSGELLIGNDDARSAQMQIARYVGTQSSADSRKSSISESSRQKSRKTTRTSYSNPGSGVPPPSSISVRCSTIHPHVPERPKDESISKQYPQHRSDATDCTKQKEITSIKSYGTSTLIHRVDELLDGASSVMRGVDAQFAAADNSDEKGKKKVQELSGDKTHDRKTRSSTVPVAGRTTRSSSSRAKQPNRP
jgi:hypothetical protein